MLPAMYHRLRTHPAAAKVTKYAVGSVLALVTSIVVFALLYVVGVGTTADSIVAFIAGAVPNWILNRRWAWEKTGRVEVAREVIGYLIVSVVALVASSVGTGAMQSWVKDNVAAHHGYRVVLVTGAYVLVQVVLFVAKYLVYEHWVFAGRSRIRAGLRASGDAIRARSQVLNATWTRDPHLRPTRAATPERVPAAAARGDRTP